jgi:uncharacterized protein YdeI (YjbR/CyaY-like superfamily)
MQMSFRGLLEAVDNDLHWVIVHVPFDPAEVWPERKRLRVKGTVNGFPVRTSLFGAREGGHALVVNRRVQKGAQAHAGTMAEIVLEPDLEERSTTVPPELAKLLKSDRAVKKWYEQLTPYMRQYIADAINDRKSAEARRRHAEQWVECMMLSMEGEATLPPVLQAAFRRQPRAHAGWDALTAIQRRNHLLAIFFLQSPEARAKRAEKTVADTLRAASKNSGSKSAGKDREEDAE